jgi:hypothetical protein
MKNFDIAHFDSSIFTLTFSLFPSSTHTQTRSTIHSTKSLLEMADFVLEEVPVLSVRDLTTVIARNYMLLGTKRVACLPLSLLIPSSPHSSAVRVLDGHAYFQDTYFVPATQTIQAFNKLFPTVIPNEKMYLDHARQLATLLHGQATHSHPALRKGYLLVKDDLTASDGEAVCYVPHTIISQLAHPLRLHNRENIDTFANWINFTSKYDALNLKHRAPPTSESEISLKTAKKGQKIMSSMLDSAALNTLAYAYTFGKIVSMSPVTESRPIAHMFNTNRALLIDVKESLGEPAAEVTFSDNWAIRERAMTIVKEQCPYPEKLSNVAVSDELWKMELQRLLTTNSIALYAIPGCANGFDLMPEVVDILLCATRGLVANLAVANVAPPQKFSSYFCSAPSPSSMTNHILQTVKIHIVANEADIETSLFQPIFDKPLPFIDLETPQHACIVILKPNNMCTDFDVWRFDLPIVIGASPHCKQQLYLVLYRIVMHEVAHPMIPNIILYPICDVDNDSVTSGVTSNNSIPPTAFILDYLHNKLHSVA